MKKNTLFLTFILLQTFVSAKYKVVSVLPEQAFYLNGGARAKFGGISRNYIKIDLPKNTVKWYYTITTTPNKNQNATIGLAAQLTKLFDPSGLTELAVTAIATPNGSGAADVYLFKDVDNTNMFLKKDDYKWQYINNDSKTSITVTSCYRFTHLLINPDLSCHVKFDLAIYDVFSFYDSFSIVY